MLTKISGIRPETLRTQVENHLRGAITSGLLRPGQKLLERELCESLGVSRASLREALRKLEAEKLILQVPHRGPEVALISLDEARELYALRRVLESHVAYEFTRLATDQEVSKLTDTVKRLLIHGKKKSQKGVLRAKADFYSVLFAGAHNGLIHEILGGLMSRVNMLRGTSLMRPDRLPRSLEEISDLLVHIQQRDAEGARKASLKHVLLAEKAALDVLSEQSKNQTTHA